MTERRYEWAHPVGRLYWWTGQEWMTKFSGDISVAFDETPSLGPCPIGLVDHLAAVADELQTKLDKARDEIEELESFLGDRIQVEASTAPTAEAGTKGQCLALP